MASRTLEPAAPIWNDSLVVTFAFRCNLACTFCMVEDVLEEPYPGVSRERFRTLVTTNDPALSGVRRIILSGGEVTTSRDLLDYVATARLIPGLEHVRIQTNAIRLVDFDYARSLRDAGVDEFFVSLHGADAEICDAITRDAGSFGRIVRGMENVVRAGGTLITNTVMVRQNFRSLGAIVDLAAATGASSIELWNYWPRVHERAAEFVVPMAELRPHVLDALSRAVTRRVPPVVRWFPRCLLPPELVRYHDDGQPRMLIEERFWDREPRYACLYAGVCEEHGTKRCSGLSTAYVELCGWEEELLMPTRKDAKPKGGDNTHPMARTLLCDEGPRRTETARAARWLAELGIPFGGELCGFTLLTLQRTRFRDRIKLGFARGDTRLDLIVAKVGDTKLSVVSRDRTSPAAVHLALAMEKLVAKAPDASLP